MDETHAQAEAQSAEAVNAAAVAAEAVERSRQAQMEVYRNETTKIVAEALRDAFGEHQASGRFVDVTRIPLLCKSVLDTHAKIAEIMSILKEQKVALDKKDEENGKRFVNQDQFDPVKRVVYGLVTLVLTVVGGAIVALVVMK